VEAYMTLNRSLPNFPFFTWLYIKNREKKDSERDVRKVDILAAIVEREKRGWN
jgi:hypothetical protein